MFASQSTNQQSDQSKQDQQPQGRLEARPQKQPLDWRLIQTQESEAFRNSLYTGPSTTAVQVSTPSTSSGQGNEQRLSAYQPQIPQLRQQETVDFSDRKHTLSQITSVTGPKTLLQLFTAAQIFTQVLPSKTILFYF